MSSASMLSSRQKGLQIRQVESFALKISCYVSILGL
jgi:hypothetical protein